MLSDQSLHLRLFPGVYPWRFRTRGQTSDAARDAMRVGIASGGAPQTASTGVWRCDRAALKESVSDPRGGIGLDPLQFRLREKLTAFAQVEPALGEVGFECGHGVVGILFVGRGPETDFRFQIGGIAVQDRAEDRLGVHRFEDGLGAT